MADKTYADLTAATDVQDADLFATWRPSGPGPLKKIQASLVKAYMLATQGTASLKNTGTSGNTVPLLDGANTWSAAQTFSGDVEFDGATTYAGSGGPGTVLIASGSLASAAATLPVALTGSYDAFILKMWDLQPVTDNQALFMRVSNDNGATYKSGASDYSYVGRYSTSGGTNTLWDAVTASSVVMQPVGSTNTNFYNGSLDLEIRKSPTSNTIFLFRGWMANAGTDRVSFDAGASTVFGSLTNVRFAYPSGNIAAGAFWKLYGVRG